MQLECEIKTLQDKKYQEIQSITTAGRKLDDPGTLVKKYRAQNSYGIS